MKLLLIFLMLCLSAATLHAQESPEAVVKRTYGWVLIKGPDQRYRVIDYDRYGESLASHSEDFTKELYTVLVQARQTWTDYKAKKRKDFWDNDPLTWSQGNEFGPLTIRLGKTSSNGAVVLVSGTEYYFRGQGLSNWQVELQEQSGRWRISNLFFNKRQLNLLVQLQKFLQ